MEEVTGERVALIMQKTLEEKEALMKSVKKRLLSASSGIEIVTNTNVPLDSVVGLEEVKHEIISVMKERGGFQRLLLFGVTGSGKAHLVRGIATELNCNLICLSRVRVLFEWQENLDVYTKILCELCKEQSFQSRNSILFLNHTDFYCQSEEEHTQALTRFLQNVQSVWYETGLKLAIIGTTFQPKKLPETITLCFNKCIYVPTLNLQERKELLLKEISKVWATGHLLTNEDIISIAKSCFLIVASEINTLISNASQVQNPNKMMDDGNNDLEKAFHYNHFVGCRPLIKDDFEKALNAGFVRLEIEMFEEFEKFYQAYGHGPFMNMYERESYIFTEGVHTTAIANRQLQEEIEKGQQLQENWMWKIFSWF